MDQMPPALGDLDREEMRRLLGTMGEKPYRGDQVFRWVHGRGVFDPAEMTDLGQDLRARLAAGARGAQLALDASQRSQDGTRKLRLRTADGRFIETVLIPERAGAAADDDDDELEGDDRAVDGPPLHPRRPKLTQCISSQVGCPLGCTFCATARLGFVRNLSAGEIVEQVYLARRLIAELPADDPLSTVGPGPARITNLVFMGMGEPFLNLPALFRALTLLSDEWGAGFSPRRMTVSTAGLPEGIARFGQLSAARRPNLALSLNATTDAVRSRLMPVNRKWSLDAVLAAVRAVPLERRRRVTFEYVLLAGVNDHLDDAHRLGRLLRGIPAKVNLIPWNPYADAELHRPSPATVEAFQLAAKRAGLAVYLRQARGDDIDAACGQLAARTSLPSS